MRSLRGVWTVAGEETLRYVRAFRGRVLVVWAIALAAAALLVPAVLDRGVAPDEGVYRIEITPGSPLLGAAQADRRFEVHVGPGARFLQGEADLFAEGPNVFYLDTARGRAAIHDFTLSTQRYFDRILEAEPNQTAAFPVAINLVYAERTVLPGAPQDLPAPAPTPTAATPQVLDQPGQVQTDLRPGTLDPPFPMRSLLLTFAYLIPLNFVGQYYAGTLLNERTRRRGVLLLSAPLTGAQILFGKSLPYAALAALAALVATLAIGAGPLAFATSLVLTAFFLSATGLIALTARSYRELTFLVTSMSVALATFLFLPAIFTQVHSIAFISPVTVVAADIRREPVTLAHALYATGPMAVAALVLATLAVHLYREEHLFTPKALTTKLLDALRTATQTRTRLLLAGALAIPFAFAAELFALAFAVTLPPRAALLGFLVAVAAIEETAKAFPLRAHAAKGPGPLHGLLVGTGFFLGEKAALLFTLVGLDLLPLGRILLASYGVTASFLLILAPWALHAATGVLLAAGAAKRRSVFIAAWIAAILVHAAYNAGVIRLLA